MPAARRTVCVERRARSALQKLPEDPTKHRHMTHPATQPVPGHQADLLRRSALEVNGVYVARTLRVGICSEAATLEQLGNPGPGKGRRNLVRRLGSNRIAFDASGSETPRRGDGAGQQRRRNTLATPGGFDVEAGDRPRSFVPIRPERLGPFQPGEIASRTHAAPTDGFVVLKRQASVDPPVGQQALERALVLTSLLLLPELPAARYAPPHAPASTAGAVGSEQLFDHRPIIRVQLTHVDSGRA